MDLPYSLDLLRDILLVSAAVSGALVFARRVAQSKDEAFAQVATRLCASEPVLRAAAARELSSFFFHRRRFRHPYRTQALNLATDALKMRRGEEGNPDPREERFVSQALVDALGQMLARARPRELVRVRLIRADLQRLILQPNRETPVQPPTTPFVFDYTDLTEARLLQCGLERATFVHAKLWNAKFCHSDLRGADFCEAVLYDADFSHCNLEKARLLTSKINEKTSFAKANLTGAQLSPKIAGLCHANGWDIKDVETVQNWRPPVHRRRGLLGRGVD